MSISINRNMPPKHRQPKQQGGGSVSYVQRTVEVVIDSLDGISGSSINVPAGNVGTLAPFIQMTKLAAQLGMTLTDADFMDSSHSVKPCPLLITAVNVGERASTSSGNKSLKNVGISHRLSWNPYANCVALNIQLYELNNTSTAVTPSLGELRNGSIEIQVIHETEYSAVTPVVTVNLSNIKI